MHGSSPWRPHELWFRVVWSSRWFGVQCGLEPAYTDLLAGLRDLRGRPEDRKEEFMQRACTADFCCSGSVHSSLRARALQPHTGAGLQVKIKSKFEDSLPCNLYLQPSRSRWNMIFERTLTYSLYVFIHIYTYLSLYIYRYFPLVYSHILSTSGRLYIPAWKMISVARGPQGSGAAAWDPGQVLPWASK